MSRFCAYVVTIVATDIANSLTSELNRVLLPSNSGRPTTAVLKLDLLMSILDLSLDYWHLEYPINLFHSNLSVDMLRFSGLCPLGRVL